MSSRACRHCGRNLEDDGNHPPSHTLCWTCWQNGVTTPPAWRRPRPAPGTPPRSVIEGLARLHDEMRQLTDTVMTLADRVEQLERNVSGPHPPSTPSFARRRAA